MSELISAVTGFLLWRKFKKTYWQWFVILLAFIFLTEMAAKFLKFGGVYKYLSNEIYRYINIPVVVISLIFFMTREFTLTKFKNICIVFTSIYIITFFTEEIMLRQYFAKFNSLSYQVGFLLILILSLISLFKLINSNKIIFYKESLHFWLAIGLLIYYIPSLPLNAFRNSLFNNNYNFALFIWNAVQILDIMMYMAFTIGMILYNPTKFPPFSKISHEKY